MGREIRRVPPNWAPLPWEQIDYFEAGPEWSGQDIKFADGKLASCSTELQLRELTAFIIAAANAMMPEKQE